MAFLLSKRFTLYTCLLYTSQVAKAVYEGALAGTEAAKALRKE